MSVGKQHFAKSGHTIISKSNCNSCRSSCSGHRALHPAAPFPSLSLQPCRGTSFFTRHSSISAWDDVGLEADGECHSALHTPQGLPDPRTAAGRSNVLGKQGHVLPLVVCSSLGCCPWPLLQRPPNHSPWAVQGPRCRTCSRTQGPAERHVLWMRILRQWHMYLFQGEENVCFNVTSPGSHRILLVWGGKGAEKVFLETSAFTYLVTQCLKGKTL